MWSVNQAQDRLQRTSSFHSTISSRSSNASTDDLEGGFLPRGQSMWAAPPPSAQAPYQPQQREEMQRSTVARLSQKFGNLPSTTTISVAPPPSPPASREQSRSREWHHEGFDEMRSRSSTLAPDEDEDEYMYSEKTPTPDSVAMKLIDIEGPMGDEVQAYIEEFKEDFVPSSKGSIVIEHDEEPYSPVSSVGPRRVPGPLEVQMQALMAKIVWIEQEDSLASVTPEEYEALQSKVALLEAENRKWQTRHEALFALRDEDVGNIIKTRGLLSKARRDLENMTRLRDEDLLNVQTVRSKLAEATRKLEKLESQSGRGTPTSARGRPSSLLLERRDTTDLFAAAKAAALEQRTLELEKRNEHLLAQLEALKSEQPVVMEPAAETEVSIDDLNRVAAHKAWKETVADLNAKLKMKDGEIARLKAASSANKPSSTSAAPLVAASGTYDWHRVEALHEEHASYRERVGGKMQRLRAEKEDLQRQLHRKEDECHALEVKVQSLQRRVAVV